MKKRTIAYIVVSVMLAFVVFCLSLMLGRYTIAIDDFFKAIFTSDESLMTARSVIFNLRLPRTIIALLTGISLSLSGLLYQETFQNKLVSPDLLGVSSGAGVGAALAIVLGFGTALVSCFSFVFGIVTVIATTLLANTFKKRSSMMLVLSGIIIGGLASSTLSLIKYFADPTTTLPTIVYFLMGSFADTTMKHVWIMLPIVTVSCVLAIIFSWRINLIALGEEEAITKGINYKLYRAVIIIFATLLTAVSVAIAGTISWIGLVIPHIVRLLVGKNTKDTIPLTIAFGGVFMMVVDLLSRLFTSSEIPLSAITGMFGTVVFIIIIISRRKSFYEH